MFSVTSSSTNLRQPTNVDNTIFAFPELGLTLEFDSNKQQFEGVTESDQYIAAMGIQAERINLKDLGALNSLYQEGLLGCEKLPAGTYLLYNKKERNQIGRSPEISQKHFSHQSQLVTEKKVESGRKSPTECVQEAPVLSSSEVATTPVTSSVKPLQRSDSSLISKIFNSNDAKEEITPSFEVGQLIRLIKAGNQALEKIQGKDVILFMGKTGAGKTTTLYFLTGKSLTQVTLETLSQRGKVLKENVIEAALPIPGFAIGHKAKSETSSVNTYDDNDTGLTFCDAPGSEDTQGPIIDIAQSVGITKAVNVSKTIRVIFVLKYSEVINDLKGSSIRDSIRLLSKFIKDIQSNYDSILTIFTHPPQDGNKESQIDALLTRLNSVHDETEGRSAEGRAIRAFLNFLMSQLEENTDKVQVLNPLIEKPQPYIEALKNLVKIDNPPQVFEYSLSEEARLQLKNQISELKSKIFVSVEKGEYGSVIKLLNDLQFLSNEIQLMTVSDAYKECIEKITEDFKSVQSSISKILEERFADSGNLTDDSLDVMLLLLKRIESKESLEQNGHVFEKETPTLFGVKNEIHQTISNLSSSISAETNLYLIQSRLNKMLKLNDKFNSEFTKQLYENICVELSTRMKALITQIEHEVASYSFASLATHLFELKQGSSALEGHLDVGFIKAAYERNIQAILKSFETLNLQISQAINKEEVPFSEIKNQLEIFSTALSTTELSDHISRDKLQEIFTRSIESIVKKGKNTAEKVSAKLEDNDPLSNLEKMVGDLYQFTEVSGQVAAKMHQDYFKILEGIKGTVLRAQSFIEFALDELGTVAIDYKTLSKHLDVLSNARWVDKHFGAEAFVMKLQEKCTLAFGVYAQKRLEILESSLHNYNISSVKELQLELDSLKNISNNIQAVANVCASASKVVNDFVLDWCKEYNDFNITAPFNHEEINKKLQLILEMEGLKLGDSTLTFLLKAKAVGQSKINTYFSSSKDEATSNQTSFAEKKKALDEMRQLYTFRSIYPQFETVYQECLHTIGSQLSFIMEESDQACQSNELAIMNDKVSILSDARVLDTHMNGYPSQMYLEAKRRSSGLSKEILGILRDALSSANADFITIENNLERLRASNNPADQTNYRNYIRVLAGYIQEQAEAISLRVRTLEFTTEAIANLKQSFQIIHKAEKSIFSHLEKVQIEQINEQMTQAKNALVEKTKTWMQPIRGNLSRFEFANAFNSYYRVNDMAQILGIDFPKDVDQERRNLEGTLYSTIESLPQKVEEILASVSQDFMPSKLEELNRILDGLKKEERTQQASDMYKTLKDKITNYLNTLADNSIKLAEKNLSFTPTKKKLLGLSKGLERPGNHIQVNFADDISNLELAESNCDNSILDAMNDINGEKAVQLKNILATLSDSDKPNYQKLCRQIKERSRASYKDVSDHLAAGSIETAGKAYEQLAAYLSVVPSFEINMSEIRDTIEKKVDQGPKIIRTFVKGQDFAQLERYYSQLITLKKYFPSEWIDADKVKDVERATYSYVQQLTILLKDQQVQLNWQVVAETLNTIKNMGSFLSQGLLPYLESLKENNGQVQSFRSLVQKLRYSDCKAQILIEIKKLPKQIRGYFAEGHFDQIQHILFKCSDFKYLYGHIESVDLNKLDEEIKGEVSSKYNDLVISAKQNWLLRDYAEFEKAAKKLTKVERELSNPPGIYDVNVSVALFNQIALDLQEFIDPIYTKSEMNAIASTLIQLKKIADEAPTLQKSILNIMGKNIERLQQIHGGSFISKVGVLLDQQSGSLESRLGKEIVAEFSQFTSVGIANLNKATAQFGIDYTLKNTDGIGIDKLKLRAFYDEFKAMYDTLVQTYIVPGTNREEIVKSVKSDGRDVHGSITNWSPAVKEKLPTLLANIFAYLTIQKSEGFFSVDQSDSVLWEPKSTQVLSILRLLGADGGEGKLLNHLIQIQTGQGKSITLAVTSIVLALFGYEVSCVCYSKLLKVRDYHDFKELFAIFGVSKKIEYATFAELSEKMINKNGDVRDLVVEMFQHAPKAKEGVVKSEESKGKILLIDEVDVFFSKDFYGNTYNPARTFSHPKLSNLINFMWSSKPATLQQVQNQPAYKELIDCYPNWKDFINKNIGEMLSDLKNFNQPLYYVINDKIGYKQHDEISYHTLYGYRTMFAYMAEEAKGKITKPTMEGQLGITLHAGQFSFAEIPNEFALILGVTGTLPSSQFEKDVMTYQYQIKNTTVAASMYGTSRFQFKEKDDVFVAGDETQQFVSLQQRILDMQKANRAIMVFFNSEVKLRKFYESEYGKAITNVAILTEESDDKAHLIKQASTSSKVTLLTESFGRGIDFICRDEAVIKSGGVHVTSTFMPDELSEEIQIKGRTARQGQPGSFDMILLENELYRFGITKQEIEDKRKGSDLYRFLDIKRNAYFEKECQQRRQSVNDASKRHNDSKQLSKGLVKYFDLPLHEQKNIRDLFLSLN